MIGILGAGNALGSRIVTNEEACRTLDVTPEWIVRNTGIRQRRYVTGGETVSTLALSASRKALDVAGVSPEQIGLTIVATFSHEYLFPAASARLHHDLGLTGGMFFDLQANCTGFLDALIAANGIMSTNPGITHALIVGAEVNSTRVDKSDSGTAPYFADGAGAVVLGPSATGFVTSAVWADSDGYEAVRCRRDVAMEQRGSVTGRLALQHLPRITREAMDKAGWTVNSVDTFVFHQASLRLIEFLAAMLHIPMSKVPTNVEDIGNTGAGSVPIAIADFWPLHGEVVFAAVGAGFGFGSICMRFP
jgi:3-oxoacyl-[acyl-carrier-protein] synthase-3